ncbi:MAG: hypothetical protein Q9175_003349 [Cornicularia normoerica]
MLEVVGKLKEGDEAYQTGKILDCYHQAIRIYNTAMTILKDRCSGFDWAVQSRGRLAVPSAKDVFLRNAYTNLLFQLRINLAVAHFQLEQYEQSRKWSGRAMMVIHEEWAQPSNNRRLDARYIKACRLNARSNSKFSRWEEAAESMQKAVTLAPHLEQELKYYNEDLKKHKEIQLKTVKTVLTNSRSRGVYSTDRLRDK